MAVKKQRALLRDVASKAQVSESTASKVLSGKATVSEETRLAVFAAADALGYRYMTKKASNIGFIVDAGSDDLVRTLPYVDDVLRGIEKVCKERAIALMYAALTPNAVSLRMENLPVMLQQRLIEGVVVANIFDEAFFAMLDGLDIPYVCIAHYHKSPTADVVVCDDEEGGYLATRYLIEHGHRSPVPAILAAPPERTSLYRRYLGYRRALDEFGLTYNPDYVLFADNAYLRGHDGMRALLDLPQPPSAVFCSSDYAALGALHTLRERGVRVPEQCSIIGFDDMPGVAYTPVPLTTIHVDNTLLGEEAVHLLMRRLENPLLPGRRVNLAVRLVERSSVTMRSMVP